jgi:hypothetical protein
MKPHPCYAAAIDDDQIIAQRIAGKSVRAIAKAAYISVAEVNRIIDAWAESAIDDKFRKHSLALELARLDELQHVFYRRALEGDTNCGLLVCKLIERRGVMLGVGNAMEKGAFDNLTFEQIARAYEDPVGADRK